MRVIRENVEREVDASKCEQLLKDGYELVETSGDSKKESPEAKAPGDLDSMGLAELRAVAKEKGKSLNSSTYNGFLGIIKKVAKREYLQLIL